MITKIKIDGFRSLEKFNLRISPGLNILVGPNGSGKTNILAFFSFLSQLTHSSVPEAISRVGGAAAFFTKSGESQFRHTVSCCIEGNINIAKDDVNQFVMGKPGPLFYQYEFIIEASKEFDEVYFKKQRFSLRRKKTPAAASARAKHSKTWDVDITADFDPKTRKTTYQCDAFSVAAFDAKKSVVTKAGGERTAITLTSAAQVLEENFFVGSLVRQGFALIREAFFVSRDFSDAEILNIIPSEVKKSEDSSRESGIKADGSGLAATLHQLKKSALSEADPRRPRSVWRFGYDFDGASKIFAQIQEFATVVNPSIINIDVNNDPFDNVLKLRVQISSGAEPIVLPFSAMSDGTVKWLSLVTAILTSRSIFAIEEPENFLHPRMQQEIVTLMRADAERRRGSSFVLMTTHSETLLNAAKPKEIIVVSFKQGKTRANRPRNRALLEGEIKKSGFGLGHFYLTGALDHD